MDILLDSFIDLVKDLNRNKTPNPMPVEQVNQLRLRKYRDPQNTETVELPESLKALLAYDRNLLSSYNMPVIRSLQTLIDSDGVIHSDTPDEELFYWQHLDELDVNIDELMPLWNNDPRLPALIPIVHVGDQRIYLYITERDEHGEYPIVRQEGMELWMEESSLIEYLCDVNWPSGKDIPEVPQWKKQREINEARDSALLQSEWVHESLWEKLEQLDAD